MASRVANPYGAATPLGEGLSSVFNAFLSAPTPEDRAANALKIHGMQAQAKSDLANAGKAEAETRGIDQFNTGITGLQSAAGGWNADTPITQMFQSMIPLLQKKSGQDIGDLTRTFAYGVNSPAAERTFMGAGGDYGNTQSGFNATDATNRRGQDVTAQTARRGQDVTAATARYNTDQTQAGLDRRFSVNTPANAITTVPSNSPIATSPTGNTTIEGPRTQTGQGGSMTPKNYRTPENQTGITYDGLTDAVTKQPLPQGTQLAGTVSASGFTEQQSKDAAFAVRLDGALKNWANLPPEFTPDNAWEILSQDARIPWTDLTIGNAAISPARQQYQQAAREILAVYLRKDSGAAITPDEVTFYGPMVLPMPFEDLPVRKQKVDSINAMRASLIAGGGPAYDEATRLLQQNNFAIDVPFAGGAATGATPRPGDTYAPPQSAGPTVNAAQELQDAQAAINAGADRAAVAARYKQRTGQDLP